MFSATKIQTGENTLKTAVPVICLMRDMEIGLALKGKKGFKGVQG